MGSMLLQQKKPEEAAKQVEVMKRIAPKHADTLYLEALLAYQAGNFSGARERIEQHLRTAPDSLLGLMLAGAIEMELKSYTQAEGHLLKALAASASTTIGPQHFNRELPAQTRSGQGVGRIDAGAGAHRERCRHALARGRGVHDERRHHAGGGAISPRPPLWIRATPRSGLLLQ